MAAATRNCRLTLGLVTLILGAHGALLCYSSTTHSPVNGEPAAIASGVFSWSKGQFTLFRVNPPLSHMIAALPIVVMGAETDWREAIDKVAGRPEFRVGARFVEINGANMPLFLVCARWCCIPISMLGGWLCWRWASLLYSQPAGMLAMAIWCVSPNVLAHGQLATADMSGAVFGALACFLFWRWLGKPTWVRAGLGGVGLGLGLLGKTTNLYLVPYLACLGAITIVSNLRGGDVRRKKGMTARFASIFFIGWIVLHAGYAFQNALVPLGSFRFTSRLMAGSDVPHEIRVTSGGNRFRGSWLGAIPSPIPADYLVGIDLQVRDFELQDPSYMRGVWRSPGWWWYYLYAATVKMPVGTLCLLGLAIAATAIGNHCAALPSGELVLMLPAIILLIIVSSQTGMNRHFRYALPAFPFIFIWLSRTASMVSPKIVNAHSLALCILFSAGTVESLWTYPHSLSFFNVFVGPHKGGRHLTDSNIDWGQDFLYLQRWLADHPDCPNLYLIDSASYPVESLLVRAGTDRVVPKARDYEAHAMKPFPGVYAVSVSQLYRYDKKYCHFLRLDPIATAGYSIYIYEMNLDDANRVRRELDLPELAAHEGREP
ncbi:MAG: glycosyltransferase family 39 protein [Thermoguttaceae bacterium]